MKHSRRRLLAAMACMLLAAGPVNAGSAKAAEAAPVNWFDSASVPRLVASQQGKPFVLVVWSLDCVYCRRNFEAIGKLQARNPALRVVTLSMDVPAAQQQVQQHLQRTRLSRNAWMFGSEMPERLRYALDPDWMGETPRTYFYRADGERRGVSGVISPADWAAHLRWAGIAG
ncbi:hypothetical protein LMG23992_05223 [Cupriavidus laharis]|uniref:Thioredoxin domain-containing protein n=1 Tax=Cupriavidus laharis TaxID=151654 RepID=A0ABM8XVI6_9BURK|nr:hypothetical protein [Cupriavidus laharis]CAG9184411.1 hypothetical protein LMG23992_05223 [Cupriavidus laharis]